MTAPLRLVSVEGPPQAPALAGAEECPLCGQTSGHAAGGCATCPMGGGCSTLTCARCGYRFVPEWRWRARLERLGRWARGRLAAWA